MTLSFHQKTIIGFMLGAVMVSMLDVLLDLLISLVTNLFELIEYSLELLLEYFFDTTGHLNEIIVFYLLLVASLYGLYLLYRKVSDLKKVLIAYWITQKKRANFYWLTLTTIQKIKEATFYTLGFTSIILLLFI
jgi:DNA-binding MltR family transcriptional regulator